MKEVFGGNKRKELRIRVNSRQFSWANINPILMLGWRIEVSIELAELG